MTDPITRFSPLILFSLFFLIGYVIMRLCERNAAKGEDNPAKFTHYSCGEDLDVPHLELDYHAFFRLALLFGILHIVALIISTASASNANTKISSVLYVIGALFSMAILLEHNENT